MAGRVSSEEEELMKFCIYDENGKRTQGFLILGHKIC